MRTSCPLASLASALLLVAVVPGALAQPSPSERKLDQIESQIEALKQTVSELRRAQLAGDAPQVPTAASDRGGTATNRLGVATGAGGALTGDAIARIRDEGLNHSQAMEVLEYLTDVIGPRLTGSPNLKRANEWTRDRFACWGLTNAHLEAWGPFGRGWALKLFSAQVVEPQDIPLIGCPNAWSPGFNHPLIADVVYLDARGNEDLERYKGKLAGKIVLASPLRELNPRFEPLARRLADTNLLQMANAGEPQPGGRFGGGPRRGVGPGRGANLGRRPGESGAPGTNAFRSRLTARARPGVRFLSFLASEKAALVVSGSPIGDGGTFFVSAASVPTPEGQGGSNPTTTPRAWSTNAPAIPPQITLAAEDYNRLVRMAQQGELLKMAVDLQVEFYDDDVMAYNTIAEIPGSDLKNEVVMLGGHLDSWHAGTGATDNAVGVSAAMEAVRIIQALKLKPRRTIRVGLWSGEEQGLFGSRAYVSQHFGYYTNRAEPTAVRPPNPGASEVAATRRAETNSPPARRLVRLREYEKLSVYFNLDNGAGKIRGIYLQGDEAARPLFRRWLEPFRDLEAETLTLSNTAGTDHTSFDAIGLPGFQFIQDPLDYGSRTHHSNEDVFDRVPAEDLQQAAVILAAFAYDAAMADQRVPRKHLVE